MWRDAFIVNGCHRLCVRSAVIQLNLIPTRQSTKLSWYIQETHRLGRSKFQCHHTGWSAASAALANKEPLAARTVGKMFRTAVIERITLNFSLM